MEIKRIPQGRCPICGIYNKAHRTNISRLKIYHHYICTVCDQRYKIIDGRPLISALMGQISIPRTTITDEVYFQNGELAFFPWDTFIKRE